MRIPMPSPRGTNRERLYLKNSNVGAAYDEASESGKTGAELLRFLADKLSYRDYQEFCKQAGLDPELGMAADEDDDVEMPSNAIEEPITTNRFSTAQDGRSRLVTSKAAAEFQRLFPEAKPVRSA